MNSSRLIRMAMRYGMRFGMKWLSDRDKAKPAEGDKRSNQREFRDNRNKGDMAKRMKTFRRMSRF